MPLYSFTEMRLGRFRKVGILFRPVSEGKLYNIVAIRNNPQEKQYE